ncbi:UDP-4-amino-4,6-dideoxy-N-acetyl-beta-L-altrosamine transaminase [Raineyella sp. LH-20]|uniref:UDP-4-amino-4, 6-dideoxy-N-acetyl-beta-L-altrosamine transaminase n=1 Tax=Raineyella sp. LH-20 TaxID=3081204 RepID=UPI00295376DE|nr:UDP-4-amino-4,6-dideoxy-N-acetyl-beta-L-altrosamine transaminase [Raineyella sp. LH-20]WOP19852.1 UDP-4-amino-4,6-dideoxy-N-acetyl-beta-L-altrosamine transaminase [Raineyella sp. LH-20]
MLPYGRQWIDEADVAAVTEVLTSDWLTTGPWVRDFEHALAARAGVAHAVSCTSGTAALHIAYAAAGIGPGDEVITTPMTYVATASGAMHHGATVVFADIEEDTGNIDPAAVEAVVSERTRVIAGVDYAGQPVDIDRLNTIAHRVGAVTVEDAAHSVGSTDKGRPVGALADLTTFSFFPTKNMTTAEGGAVLTDDDALALRADEFHKIGVSRDRSTYRHPDEGAWWYEVPSIGLNYRLSDVHAALGLSQLGKLDDFKARRTALFARYQEALAGVDGLRVPTVRSWVDPTWHLYPVRILGGRRREVFEKLRAAGIGVQVNYIPVYWHPVFEDLGYRRGLCPNAERFYEEEISLPMFARLSYDEQDRVIDTLRGILGA